MSWLRFCLDFPSVAEKEGLKFLTMVMTCLFLLNKSIVDCFIRHIYIYDWCLKNWLIIMHYASMLSDTFHFRVYFIYLMIIYVPCIYLAFMFIVYMISFSTYLLLSCRQKFCLLQIHSGNLCLLIVVFSGLTFNVITNMTDLNITFLLISEVALGQRNFKPKFKEDKALYSNVMVKGDCPCTGID